MKKSKPTNITQHTTARAVRNKLISRHSYIIDGLCRLSAGYQPILPQDLFQTEHEEPEFVPSVKALESLLKATAPEIKLLDDVTYSNIDSIDDVYSAVKEGLLSKNDAQASINLILSKAEAEDRQELMKFVRSSGVSLV